MEQGVYAVYFDGAEQPDTVFGFGEAAISHACDNVDGGYVGHARVVRSLIDGTLVEIFERGRLPELEPPASGPRHRLSSLAAR